LIIRLGRRADIRIAGASILGQCRSVLNVRIRVWHRIRERHFTADLGDPAARISS
jgi:hypothetical protein